MEQRKLVTAADMDKMTPQERADAVNASVITDWSEVPESIRAEILATASRLGQERRQTRE